MPEKDLEYEILRQIADEPVASQRGMATGLSAGLSKIKYFFRALDDKGWVKWSNCRRSSNNKLGHCYPLTPPRARGKVLLATD